MSEENHRICCACPNQPSLHKSADWKRCMGGTVWTCEREREMEPC